MTKITPILLALFLLTSCVRINFHGLTSGYRKENKKTTIVFIEDLSNMSNFDSKTIYSVNGNTLRKELTKYENVLVYFWSPFCSSASCIALNAAQRICDDQKLELFVVADCYDNNIPYFNEQIKNPILTMDHKYYKTNMAQKISKRFTNDLIQAPVIDTLEWYRFFRFKNGKFTTAQRELL